MTQSIRFWLRVIDGKLYDHLRKVKVDLLNLYDLLCESIRSLGIDLLTNSNSHGTLALYWNSSNIFSTVENFSRKNFSTSPVYLQIKQKFSNFRLSNLKVSNSAFFQTTRITKVVWPDFSCFKFYAFTLEVFDAFSC